MSTDVSWDPRKAGARGRGVRGGVHRATHLFALSAFAFAQPLFAKLGPAPGYFAAHGMTSTEVVLFGVALIVVPTLVLIALEAVARIFGRRARWIVHLLLVAALVALIVLPPVGGLPTAIAYVLAGLAGVGFAAAYARWHAVRAFTTVLGAAPLAFLAAFLFASPTAKLVSGDQLDAWRAHGSFRPPIVVVQFDALPSLLLETPQRHIDAVRFPNLARLARDGVWYRNASSVHTDAAPSVSAFADGRLPRKRTAPVVQDHNPNLFTLLGPDYRMNVAEEGTALCPYEFCLRTIPAGGPLLKDTWVVFQQIVRPEDARASLPSISDRWTRFDEPIQTRFRTRVPAAEGAPGRLVRFGSWLSDVGHGGARPEFDYVHVPLPAEPWEFVPRGQRYVTPDGALGGPGASVNSFLSQQQEQRALLQLGYTDRLVGRLTARLKQAGIYDDALVVVTGDRGEAFQPPSPRARVADVSSIPLFVKYPRGHGPRGTDDRYVRSVDVLPTVAQILGVPVPPVDGRALQDPDYHGRQSVRIATPGGVVRMSARRWERYRRLSLARRLRLFGSGARSLYAFGPDRKLVGRPVSDFQIVPPTSAPATIDGATRFANVNPIGPVCLCQLGGQVGAVAPAPTGGAVAPAVAAPSAVGVPPATGGVSSTSVVADATGIPLAVAVNGTIVATAEGFAPRGRKRLNWSAMIPPRAYHDGRNLVQLYRIVDRGHLEQLGSAP